MGPISESLARRPVEVVTAIQRDFCAGGKRIGGGRVHDLLITPSGDYSSTSGDRSRRRSPPLVRSSRQQARRTLAVSRTTSRSAEERFRVDSMGVFCLLRSIMPPTAPSFMGI